MARTPTTKPSPPAPPPRPQERCQFTSLVSSSSSLKSFQTFFLWLNCFKVTIFCVSLALFHKSWISFELDKTAASMKHVQTNFRYSPTTSNLSSFLKYWPSPASFCLFPTYEFFNKWPSPASFCLFPFVSYILQKKTKAFFGIWTWINGVEGKHPDHLTTTTALSY